MRRLVGTKTYSIWAGVGGHRAWEEVMYENKKQRGSLTVHCHAEQAKLLCCVNSLSSPSTPPCPLSSQLYLQPVPAATPPPLNLSFGAALHPASSPHWSFWGHSRSLPVSRVPSFFGLIPFTAPTRLSRGPSGSRFEISDRRFHSKCRIQSVNDGLTAFARGSDTLAHQRRLALLSLYGGKSHLVDWSQSRTWRHNISSVVELFPLSSDSLHCSQRVTIKKDRRLKPDVINAERRTWRGVVLSPHRENRWWGVWLGLGGVVIQWALRADGFRSCRLRMLSELVAKIWARFPEEPEVAAECSGVTSGR